MRLRRNYFTIGGTKSDFPPVAAQNKAPHDTKNEKKVFNQSLVFRFLRHPTVVSGFDALARP